MVDGTRDTASGGGVALRLFAALHVPGDAAMPLTDVATAIAERVAGVRAVGEDQLHVTFAYLGEVAEELVPGVARALDDAAAAVPGPTSCTFGVPVVLGSGHAVALDASLDLHAVLDAARDSFVDAVRAYAPHVDERPWHPHVTLLRSDDAAHADVAAAALRDIRVPRPTVMADLRLYASLPAPGGRLHRVVHAAPLGTAGATVAAGQDR